VRVIAAIALVFAIIGCGEDYSNVGESPERPLYMVCVR
jgi:hypothetical protein